MDFAALSHPELGIWSKEDSFAPLSPIPLVSEGLLMIVAIISEMTDASVVGTLSSAHLD
jgi:hypothetical protein